MSSSLEQTIDRLATKDVCQHINYQYNHWIFFYIFVGITDAVFLFQKIKEHFVLLSHLRPVGITDAVCRRQASVLTPKPPNDHLCLDLPDEECLLLANI